MGAVTQGAVNDINLLKGGSYSASRDIIKHRIWDERYIDGTVSDHTFFVNQIGSNWKVGFQKTIIETNMTESGRLPTMQTFIGKRMGVALISPLTTDTAVSEQVVQAYYNILQSSVFEFSVAGRAFDAQIHGREFLSPVAVAGAGNTDTAAQSPTRYGDLIASGWTSLDAYPFVIDNQINFSVLQRFSNPDTTMLPRLTASSTLLKNQYCVLQVTIEGVLSRAK
jgi:hypothetical protein